MRNGLLKQSMHRLEFRNNNFFRNRSVEEINPKERKLSQRESQLDSEFIKRSVELVKTKSQQSEENPLKLEG